jgi:hypothetical protein
MFNINYIGRVSSSANNDIQKFWVYNGTTTGSNEAVATIAASGYFNDFMVNVTRGIGPLGVNDLIIINGNDASAFYMVSAVTTNVTVSVFDTTGVVGTANIQDSAVTAAKIATDAVTTAKILAANVTLAKLAAGITPSHVVKYAARATTVGGSATEAFTVTGALATDIQSVTVVNNGTNNVTLLESVLTNNTLTLTFSANPGNDAIIAYSILRAAA